MKVIFCAHDIPNYVGGPNTWLCRLLPELRRRGIDAKVLFQTFGKPADCPTLAYLRNQGFDCPATPWLPYGEDRVSWVLQRVAEDLPDIFVPNLSVSAFYASRWIKEAGTPTVGVLHSDDLFHDGVQDVFVSGDPGYRLSAIVCISQYLEKRARERNPKGILIRRIPCGVPLPAQVAEPSSNIFRIAYVGRLVQEAKRVAEVTRAFCKVVREIPGTEALIFGDGPLRGKVEEILAESGNDHSIILMGRVKAEEIQTHLLSCHLIVLLSDYEGLPISLMEGMACGLVPVCLDIHGGVRELVEDGITGLLVKDRGDDFVAAVRNLKFDRDLWIRLSRGARAKIANDYTIEDSSSEWEELFRNLEQKSPPPRMSPFTIPSKMRLPPVHSGLSREDNRRPNFLRRIWRKFHSLGT